MTKLLVPVDGSANAERAVAHAIATAKAMGGAEVVLLNVQERLDRWFAHGLNSDAARAHLREAGEAASAGARKLLDASGCNYRFDIVFGHPAEVIARVASELGCDGIVMGTRGLGEMESVFLGSTSYKVVHMASVPVTLVR
ncbi:MAG: universal stress protein [Burkholderiales bacterium]|nr:universal stress protein [Burkholderiales bacterium]GIK87076.1 MAG: universal stress protein [Betaproteobacteria bacterium]